MVSEKHKLYKTAWNKNKFPSLRCNYVQQGSYELLQNVKMCTSDFYISSVLKTQGLERWHSSKSAYHSCIGSNFSSPYACQATQNDMYLQLQGSYTSGLHGHLCSHAYSHRQHIHIIKNIKINLKKTKVMTYIYCSHFTLFHQKLYMSRHNCCWMVFCCCLFVALLGTEPKARTLPLS